MTTKIGIFHVLNIEMPLIIDVGLTNFFQIETNSKLHITVRCCYVLSRNEILFKRSDLKQKPSIIYCCYKFRLIMNRVLRYSPKIFVFCAEPVLIRINDFQKISQALTFCIKFCEKRR